MARTASFDRHDVARAARAVFWSLGYEGAAIPDLEAATGLSRSSIYNSFGSKLGLFEAAVESYLNEVVRPRIQPLTGDVVEPGALEAYLRDLRETFAELTPRTASNGCLLVNTAGSPIAKDAHVAQVIADYRSELGSAFSRGVAAHYPGISPADVSLKSESITALVISAFALVRVSKDLAVQNLETALRVIETNPSS
ncbi:TetR/AcrR family transcriptional regulator [Neomicrococcus lactis]|uniref:AcrR family transcriptional regulator n=1 Tax=Neomicrococcus lactis TaxID=732241 RepID=A0A7W8YDB7_9MICC|nr:TetR/AcrR family transcriptional regulator [Neomicrococcus lactis]MBB5599125.1 AcrR family transcriptional regulator [Neomicrococcus lactis]